jgi:hypothetical protein
MNKDQKSKRLLGFLRDQKIHLELPLPVGSENHSLPEFDPLRNLPTPISRRRSIQLLRNRPESEEKRPDDPADESVLHTLD